MKKIIAILTMVFVSVIFTGQVICDNGPAPNSGDGISDGSGMDTQGGPNYVVKVTLASPSGQTEESKPIYSWAEDPASTWYKLWVGNSYGEKIHAQWYESSDICSDGSCTITLESEFPNAGYEWWVKSWNDLGSVWSDGMSFTVPGDDSSPSKVVHTSPSGTTQDSTPTFTWEEDPAASWYRLWVGYPSDQKIFAQWYESSDICSDGICSIVLDPELKGGKYEAWVKSWNSYGSIWSEGLEFEISNIVDKISITKIVSNQFRDVEVNYLPRDEFGGAGATGENFILMSTREDDKAYVKARINVNDSSVEDKVYARLAILRYDEWILTGGSVFVGNNKDVELSTFLDSGTQEGYYFVIRVVAGIDSNGNYHLDQEELAESVISNGHFRVVSKSIYEWNKGYMMTGSWLYEVGGEKPNAVEFAQSFLTNETINLDSVTESVVGIDEIKMGFPEEKEEEFSFSHMVGIYIDLNSTGTIKDYEFSEDSSLSEKLRNSNILNDKIRTLFVSKSNEIQAHDFSINPIFNFNWPLDPVKLLQFGPADPDLFYTFGKANHDITLEGEIRCVEDYFIIDWLEISGAIYDLYDWHYESFENQEQNKINYDSDRRMATVQAGFWTHGIGGGVFRVKVNVSGMLPDFLGNQLGSGCGYNNEDIDGDGYTISNGDCDDLNGDINPDSSEVCGDSIDQNCDGVDETCSGGRDCGSATFQTKTQCKDSGCFGCLCRDLDWDSERQIIEGYCCGCVDP